LLAAAALGTPAASADDLSVGRIGPSLSLTGNGRALNPAGRLSTVGDFPTGGALSPDGRFYWAIDAGHGRDDVQIIDVASGAVAQVLPLPGGYVGVVFSPDGRTAYVSGEPRAGGADAGEPQGTAKGGDVLHVFSVDPRSGGAAETGVIPLPATSGGTAQQHASNAPIATPGPGVSSAGLGWPIGLAISPDGSRVVAALNQADQVAVVDTKTRQASLIKTGTYPYGVAIDSDGKRAFVSNEGDGTISVLDLAAASTVATISVGSAYSHPEGLAYDPVAKRLYVAVTQRDLISVVDTTTMKVVHEVSVARPPALGTEPVALALAPDGRTLYSADAGEDAIAAIALTPRTVRGVDIPPPPVAGPDGQLPALPNSITPLGPPAAAAAAASAQLAPPPAAAARVRLVYAVPSLHQLRIYVRLEGRSRARIHDRRRRGNVLASLRRRYANPYAVPACSGPTLADAQRYVARALTLLRRRAHVSARRPLGLQLRRAAAALPPRRPCPAAARAAGVRRAARAAATAPDAQIAAFQVIGRIPTAAYTSDVRVSPAGDRLVWLAAKGLGAGPNPEYGTPFANSGAAPYGTYVPDKLLGRAGVLAAPVDGQLLGFTPFADAQSQPQNFKAQPAGSALRPNGPIKHVFYFVRENRTYDQIFGSEPRGDGAPQLQIFDDNGAAGPAGGVTPNAHALARRFPLLDHFYANSEVSIDGHLITAGGTAIDYAQKALHPNYSGRGRVNELGTYPITFGPNHLIFDQAVTQGVSFRNYGENAGAEPSGNDGRSTIGGVAAADQRGYPFFFGCQTSPVGPPPPPPAPNKLCDNDSGTMGPAGNANTATSRFDYFQNQFAALGTDATWPAFSYIQLPNDHTNGTRPGLLTPRALVADNDLGLGQFVDLISHSAIWHDSAIFVIEDDSQDGADHVDAHRMPAFVISPWAVQPGAVVHTRYDQDSALRSAEILLGLKPLSLQDGSATPMYDAFTSDGSFNDAPYTAITPQVSLTEQNAPKAANARLSERVPFGTHDAVPQEISDRIIWQSVYGPHSVPPPPGPNASPAEHARATTLERRLARSR